MPDARAMVPLYLPSLDNSAPVGSAAFVEMQFFDLLVGTLDNFRGRSYL
jgi:hypothetical protein